MNGTKWVPGQWTGGEVVDGELVGAEWIEGHSVEIPADELSEIRAAQAACVEPLEAAKERLKAQVDAGAMAARLKYTSPGMDGTYRQKLDEAKAALADSAPTPGKYPTLAASIGIEDDPTSGAPATDVLGVARLVDAIASQWIPLNAAIERTRLGTKKAIDAAADADAAIEIVNGITWP